MFQRELKLVSCDGLALQGREWVAANPVAVVCLVHGLGEHSGRYQHVAEALTEDGYTLLAMDLRGHGKSEGKRGHAENYTVLWSDLALLLMDAQSRHPNLPVFLYGHSLGGNLVLSYVLEKKPDIAGIIVSAPLLRLAFDPPSWKTAAMRLMKKLRINLSLPSGLDAAALSRDMDVVNAYRSDPLIHGSVSPSLALDMLRYGENLLDHASEFTGPLLLMHGTEDRITSIEATKIFSKKTCADCTLKIWEDVQHEPHNDPEKGAVLAFVVDWLKSYS